MKNSPTQSKINTIRVFVCDDDQTIVQSTVCMLKKICHSNDNSTFNIKVETANNGIECIYKIYKDYIGGLKYDILLIDETMPFMKGTKCAQILKEIIKEKYLNHIKIICVTSLESDDSSNSSSYVDEYINKPISKDVMWRILNYIKT
jgi:CheY-like chemotaxis protein